MIDLDLNEKYGWLDKKLDSPPYVRSSNLVAEGFE
jgi:hypothetical protein